MVFGRSGRLVCADDPYRDSAGRMLSRAPYPLHRGKVIGPNGVCVVFCCACAPSRWASRAFASGGKAEIAPQGLPIIWPVGAGGAAPVVA